MVRVFPFRGILYNKEKIDKFSRVMSPPYDVLSSLDQEYYYGQSNFNIIRLILGKEFPGDNKYNNKYLRAAAFLDGWQRHEVLITDPKPAFYIYEQKFVLKRKKYLRLGFLGLLRLEDLGRGKVFLHEETFPKAKLDRLHLMRATAANLDAIFALYSDPEEKINKTLKKFMKRKPRIEAKDKEGVVHRLWQVNLKTPCRKITEEMKDKSIFIADGHHRYEAALRYKDEMKMSNAKFSEEEIYNHVLMYFTPLEGSGLKIIPIHRVLKGLAHFNSVKFEEELKEYFEIQSYSASKKTKFKVLKKLRQDLEKKGKDKHVFGLYLGGNKFYLLTLKSDQVVEEMLGEEKSKTWKNLDVTILDTVVFNRLLNISAATENHIKYVKDEEEAIKLVDEGNCLAAFLLNATKLEELTVIASHLEKLPHKSTYFYPKLLSGLVLNKIVHGEKITL